MEFLDMYILYILYSESRLCQYGMLCRAEGDWARALHIKRCLKGLSALCCLPVADDKGKIPSP